MCILGDRLTVGQEPLKLLILVRLQVSQLIYNADMHERPKLRIVGGTDYVPPAKPTPVESVKRTTESDALVALWADVTGKRPADFFAKINSHLVQGAARRVRAWSVADLHAYLSRTDLWKRPSFTKAVFDEVGERIRRRDFSPVTESE